MTDPDLCVLPPPGSFPIKTAGATTSQGIFAPLVLGAKSVMGAQELKEFRASVIAKHSKDSWHASTPVSFTTVFVMGTLPF